MIDLNSTVLGVTLEDGSELNVIIDPVHAEINGVITSTGVYDLYSKNFHGLTPQSADNGDNRYLGCIAFSMENSYEWIYDGAILAGDEIDQVVLFIQKDRETLHSFFFKQTIGSVEHDYRVTENEGHFLVEKDGEYLTEIQQNEDWEVVTGEQVDNETWKLIVTEIKNRYE